MLRIKLTIVSALMTLMLAGCGGGGQHAGTLIGGGVGTALALDFVLHDEVKIYDRYEQRMKMVPRDRRFTWYEKAAIVAASAIITGYAGNRLGAFLDGEGRFP